MTWASVLSVLDENFALNLLAAKSTKWMTAYPYYQASHLIDKHNMVHENRPKGQVC